MVKERVIELSASYHLLVNHWLSISRACALRRVIVNNGFKLPVQALKSGVPRAS